MIGLITVLLLAGIMVMESPDVQTRIAKKFIAKVEESLGGKIQYGSLAIKPFNTLVIKDLAVIDDEPWPDEFNKGLSPLDTIISIKSVSATFSILGLVRKEGVHLSRVDIKDGALSIVSEGNKYRSNINRFLRGPGPPEIPTPGPAIFDIRKLTIDGFHFRLHNLMKRRTSHVCRGVGINWEDLDVHAGRLDAREVSFKGRKLSMIVDHIDVVDKSGFSAPHVSGRAKCGMGQVLLDDIVVQDGVSDISVPHFTMNFQNAFSFRDYVNAVRMDGVLGRSTIDGQTLKYFLDALPDNCVRLEVEPGTVISGYVNDLDVQNLKFRDRSGVSGDLSCHLTGLTDFKSMILSADVRQLEFTTGQAMAIVNSIVPSACPDIRKYADGVGFTFTGSASGPVNRLLANGSLSSENGTLGASLDIRNALDKSRVTEISGTASSKDFNIGKTIGVAALGECTMRTGFRAKLVPGEPSVIIDSLGVDKIGILGYSYTGIEAAGKLTGRSFDGKVVCDDPNLNFLFQGICDFSTKTQNALYRFYANLGYADLDALHLDPRGIGSKASCRVIANYKRIVKGDGLGSFKIEDILLEDVNGAHDIGGIEIESTNGANGNSIRIDSKFASGSFKGTGSLPAMIEDLKEITLRKHLPALSAEKNTGRPSGDYEMIFDFHDSRDLLSFVKPGLYIADSTRFRMNVSHDGWVTGSLVSPRLALGPNYIKGAELEFDNSSGGIGAVLTDREISVAGVKLDRSTVTAYAAENEAALGIHINENEDAKNYAELYVNADFSRDASDSLLITAHPLQSYFKLAESIWDIDRSDIRINGGKVAVDGFRISNGNQEIILDGTFSSKSRDSLSLDIRNIGLSLLGDLTGKKLSLGGALNGKALLVSGKGREMLLDLDMFCDSAHVRGTFVPSTKRIDLDADLNSMNIAIAEPFLKGVASNLGGCIDGDIGISGTLDEMDIRSSSLTLENARLTVNYTGASYTLDGPVSIQNDGIQFRDVSISDDSGGRGTISGGLLFDRLKDMRLAAKVNLNGLKAIDTGENSGNAVYGKLAADADLNITGPFDNIRIDGTVSTSGSGQLHVPLNSAVASTGSDLLVFKEKEVVRYIDPYEEMMLAAPKTKKKGKGNIGIHVHAQATPDVKAMLELNKSTGNVITASGTASVLLDMETASGEMNLAGDYLINNGNLHFELPGIVKKEFSLKDGSSVKFSGPVKNSELDITAVYNLKTSLSTLLADTTTVSTRRPVECSIKISDKLTSPQVSFGVDVPDLDPGSRTKITEALNTEDKVQKQFIALLVMGSFLPNEQSGVVNSANIVYSNVGEIMSNQLNNILQKLDIPVDLGLGYQQNQGGTDIFDVAISTQLFNNRVEIGGTVGNRQYRTSKSPYGDVVGDIDISIKLDKAGQFKMNLFSHSADEFTSFLDYSQRNGLGFAYQKEYDNFWKMLKESFTPKYKFEKIPEVKFDKPLTTITIE